MHTPPCTHALTGMERRLTLVAGVKERLEAVAAAQGPTAQLVYRAALPALCRLMEVVPPQVGGAWVRRGGRGGLRLCASMLGRGEEAKQAYPCTCTHAHTCHALRSSPPRPAHPPAPQPPAVPAVPAVQLEAGADAPANKLRATAQDQLGRVSPADMPRTVSACVWGGGGGNKGREGGGGG
jgi:hypothetical protein